MLAAPNKLISFNLTADPKFSGPLCEGITTWGVEVTSGEGKRFRRDVENYSGSRRWRDDRTIRGPAVIWQFIRDDKNLAQSDTRDNYRRTLRTAEVMPVIMPGTREKEREPVIARPADGTALAMELHLLSSSLLLLASPCAAFSRGTLR